jgi:AcrR family transcriptional regulator
MMDKKEIQEKRMKGYFIEAAKKIIRGEGIRAVSVRSIADEAGYSYATLYNYFNDIRDLLFFCIKDFLGECDDFIKSQKHPEKNGLERIRSLSKAYMNYFVQYPGIFDLMFMEKMPEIAYQERITVLIGDFFDNLFLEDLNYCIKKKILKEKAVKKLKEIHKVMVHGLLLFYLSRRSPWNYGEFIEKSEMMMNYLFND